MDTISQDQVDFGTTRRRIEDALRKKATAADLIRIADILGVPVATTFPQRPCFGPEQIRCIHHIHKGMLCYMVHKGRSSYSTLVEVISDPFQKKDSLGWGWWLKVRRFSDAGMQETISLSDHSVNPYPDGHWNDKNYLAFSHSVATPSPCSHHRPCPQHCC